MILEKRKMFQTLVIVTGLFSFLGFNAPLKKPVVKFKKYVVKKVTYKDTRVDFIYSVDNPNPVGLKNISVSYKLFLGYEKKPADVPPFASGNDVRFNIKKKSVSPFVLPMKINYVGFFKSAGKLTKTILQGKKTIPFVLETTFYLNLKILKFRIPIDTKGELPLPKADKKMIM